MNQDLLKPEKETNLDVILDWLKNDEPDHGLTPQQKQLIQRYSFADDLLRTRSRWTDEELMASIRKKHKVSRITAYNDLRIAKQIFGSTFIQEKDYWKKFLVNEAKQGIRRVLKMTKYDPKAHKGFLDLIKEITGAHLEDTPKYGDRRPSTNFIFLKVENNQQYQIQIDSLEQAPPDVVEMTHQIILEQNQLEMPNNEDSEPTE